MALPFSGLPAIIRQILGRSTSGLLAAFRSLVDDEATELAARKLARSTYKGFGGLLEKKPNIPLAKRVEIAEALAASQQEAFALISVATSNYIAAQAAMEVDREGDGDIDDPALTAAREAAEEAIRVAWNNLARLLHGSNPVGS